MVTPKRLKRLHAPHPFETAVRSWDIQDFDKMWSQMATDLLIYNHVTKRLYVVVDYNAETRRMWLSTGARGFDPDHPLRFSEAHYMADEFPEDWGFLVEAFPGGGPVNL